MKPEIQALIDSIKGDLNDLETLTANLPDDVPEPDGPLPLPDLPTPSNFCIVGRTIDGNILLGWDSLDGGMDVLSVKASENDDFAVLENVVHETAPDGSKATFVGVAVAFRLVQKLGEQVSPEAIIAVNADAYGCE